jgi:hypothetical protein
MRVVGRSSQGDHSTPGRGQAIAPTMDEPGKTIRGIVGAHPCGRPVGIPIRLSSPDKPMEQLVRINVPRPATLASPWSRDSTIILQDDSGYPFVSTDFIEAV